jgi:hypothetical protein
VGCDADHERINPPEVKTVKTPTNTKHRLRTVIAAAALTGTILAGTTGVAAAAQGDTLVHIEADDSLGSYRASDGNSNYDAVGLYSVGLPAVQGGAFDQTTLVVWRDATI